MEIVGPVPIKINGRYAITVTNFNVKKSQNTKQHAGAFGVFGISQGAAILVSGSFKVSIPKTGFEFQLATEFFADREDDQLDGAAGGGMLISLFVAVATDMSLPRLATQDPPRHAGPSL